MPDDNEVSVARAMVRTMVAGQVDAVFLNPGTDTAPFQEAVAALAAAGEPVPRVVLCLHEGVALAAAHAYFARTHRPQVVMVHVDVGTQNLGSMVHNAARADAGVVIIAGRTPMTAYGELPGGRDTPVHWMQDVPDQAGVVRPYVKWAADVTEPSTATRLLRRALQVAASAPSGPVYLTVARETLMAGTTRPTGPTRLGPPVPPAPDPDALAEAARRLRAARRPVVVTSRVGQVPEAVTDLVAVVEAVGAVVVDARDRVNFPSDHPAYLYTDTRTALTGADVVLVVDAPIPWVPQHAQPNADAFVISIDLDPVHASMPGWSFPVDLGIQCSPAAGLTALRAALDGHREPWMSAGRPKPGDRLSAVDVAATLNELLTPDDVVIEEATTNFESLRGVLERTKPGTYYRSGGSGLGWCLGAVLGMKLADPDRRVVGIVGDGAFVFGSPAAALSALHQHEAPALVVVLRNGGYAASRAPVLNLFPDGESSATGVVVGTMFPETPDVALLATACGAHGETVTELAELAPALRRGLDAVKNGQAAVVSVAVSSPWIR
jgi:acetolactate synthase-1/2/3 large subunit